MELCIIKVLPEFQVCSIASETIENSDACVSQTAEAVKQDCESKAFVRLAAKIKKKFPRLPITLQQIDCMLQRMFYRYAKSIIGIILSDIKKAMLLPSRRNIVHFQRKKSLAQISNIRTKLCITILMQILSITVKKE